MTAGAEGYVKLCMQVFEKARFFGLLPNSRTLRGRGYGYAAFVICRTFSGEKNSPIDTVPKMVPGKRSGSSRFPLPPPSSVVPDHVTSYAPALASMFVQAAQHSPVSLALLPHAVNLGLTETSWLANQY